MLFRSSRWNCDEDSHWHVCEDPNCPVSGARIDNSAHLFGERYVAYAANCHSEGLEYEICQICGYQRNYYIPATDHDYQPVGGFEKVDDSVYLEEYGCQYCDQYVLRWDAMEYDQNLSQGVDLYSGSAIRFKSGMVENQGGTIQTGAHIIYKLNIPTYLANVGLAFNMSQSNSSSSRVFYSSSGQGYIFDDNGNLVQTTTKYGLRINGQEIRLGDDYYDYVSNSNINWYNWPVKFDLVAGENTIDIYCLDSNYRARIYDFQITGVPYIAPTHIHEAANHLEYDGYTHYNPCTNNDGVRFNEEPHVFGEYVTISDPTCTEYGQQMRTCSVCGYEEYTSLYPHGHNYEQYYTIQEPTCTQEGIQESTCTICGVTEQWIISPYGHQWDEGVVTVEPTHTVPGEKLYTCLVCGEQKVENIPAGHNWGDATYIGPANEGQVGYNKRVCQDDGTIEIDIRAMDATLYEGGLKSVEAAQAEAKRCLECGCHDFNDCSLVRLANLVQADTRRFKGEFHPGFEEKKLVTIERNQRKCILCGQCVRACEKIAGKGILGLVGRGFKTVIKPEFRDADITSVCGSCRLCAETCPTGALRIA